MNLKLKFHLNPIKIFFYCHSKFAIIDKISYLTHLTQKQNFSIQTNFNVKYFLSGSLKIYT